MLRDEDRRAFASVADMLKATERERRRDAKPKPPKRKRPTACSACHGDGWFTTEYGTVMCSACRGKGHR